MPTKHTRRDFLQKFTGAAVDVPTFPLTAAADFFTTQQGQIPAVQTANWQLSIGGMIQGGERVFRWHDLDQFAQVERVYTIECAGNPAGGDLTGTAQWGGILLSDLMQEITVHPAATHAEFLAADGYRTFIRLADLRHPQAMLALSMYGQPLTTGQGYPARLLVPGLYGYKMPKWILRIDLTPQPRSGFWESRGWSADGAIQAHAIITNPRPHTRYNQHVQIAGIALAGRHAITAVEVRIDGGRWMPAHLVKNPSADQRTGWYLDWQFATSGDYLIEARALDSSGFVQSDPASIHKIMVHVL